MNLRGRDGDCPFFGTVPGHVCRRRDGKLVREGGACWTWAREDAMRALRGHPAANQWPAGWPTP